MSCWKRVTGGHVHMSSMSWKMNIQNLNKRQILFFLWIQSPFLQTTFSCCEWHFIVSSTSENRRKWKILLTSYSCWGEKKGVQELSKPLKCVFNHGTRLKFPWCNARLHQVLSCTADPRTCSSNLLGRQMIAPQCNKPLILPISVTEIAANCCILLKLDHFKTVKKTLVLSLIIVSGSIAYLMEPVSVLS